MTDLIGELRARRLVRELDPIRRPGAGRPTRPIAFDGEPWCVLGVHVDVDQITMSASTLGGHELWQESTDVDLREAGPSGFETVRKGLRDALQRIPADKRLVAIELGVPGYVAADGGTVSSADGLDWQGFALGTAVEETLHEAGITQAFVGVSGECQLAGLYASRVELGLQPDSIAAYLGGVRHIGSGVIIRGEIYRGAEGGGGDFGHLNVAPDGPTCWCGRQGCLESLVGPAALLVSTGMAGPDEAKRLVDSDTHRAIEMIVDSAQNGDATATAALASAGRLLGRAVDDIIGMVNPHAVILGGYLGILSPYLLPSLRPALETRLAARPYAETEILALEKLCARVVGGATLAARDACFAAPLELTQPVA
jgi:predicted NBD/HSP70 family sugar kinase